MNPRDWPPTLDIDTSRWRPWLATFGMCMSAFSVPGALLFRELSDALLPEFRIGIRLLGFWTTVWFSGRSLASDISPGSTALRKTAPAIALDQRRVLARAVREPVRALPGHRGSLRGVQATDSSRARRLRCPRSVPVPVVVGNLALLVGHRFRGAPFKGTFAVVMLSFTALFVKGIAALSGSAIVWSIHVRQEELARVGPAPRAEASEPSRGWGSHNGAAT